MRYNILGLLAAGGLWLGTASTADAQFSLSIGSPFGGGVSIGTPYVGGYGNYGAPYSGYSYGSVLPGTSYYNSGYSGYAAPATGYYNSGYSGYAAPATGYYSSGYSGMGYPGVVAYGYPRYGYSPYYGGYGGMGVGVYRGGWGWR